MYGVRRVGLEISLFLDSLLSLVVHRGNHPIKFYMRSDVTINLRIFQRTQCYLLEHEYSPGIMLRLKMAASLRLSRVGTSSVVYSPVVTLFVFAN